MANFDKDEVPMLSDVHPQLLDENVDSRVQAFTSWTRSASISIPTNSMEPFGNEANLVGYTGPLRSERRAPLIQMSGPIYINRKAENLFDLNHGVTGHKIVEPKAEKFPSFNGMDQHDWTDDRYAGKNEHLLRSGQLGVCNDPYCTTCPTYYNFKPAQQKHSKASVIFDPKFHNALYGDAKGWATKFISFLNSYIPGVMNPHTKVVQHWNKFFVFSCLVAVFVDPLFFFLLSVQQDNKCIVINGPMATTIVIFRSMTDFVYLLNILLQRVNQCLRDACHQSSIKEVCMSFIDCGHGDKHAELGSDQTWLNWTTNANATACFTQDGFPYGIYVQAVNLTSSKNSAITRYVYSLFWGFQQISTLAGNLIPSYFVWEVLFTMSIVGLGLLLFAFLIGNIQNFLQALVRRRLEMSLRRRDIEQWMSHRRLPQELRRKVLEAERYNWAATSGVNEGVLLENLPEDLQRDIRRHLFKFVKKVWIFALMDEHVLDAICERLKPKIYIKGSEILYRGGLVEKMVFIVRGKLDSIGEDGTIISLSEGNVCGEELLTWCLEHSSVSKDGKKLKIPGQRLRSSRTVRCLTNVEAFSLRAADLEEVTNIFARSLRNPRVQGAIRYESPYWRGRAATRIQVAWRYRQKLLKRRSSSQSNQSKNYFR
ncbi:probable cyclic nucleotide-gated ion channel 20, chloroplastic isoform X7 [Manihot esculenta]|uniref:probable cyclic nucleotide-gated ion channel 20, chloroplastic isoform X7 n=1 Tax=Manihot esculenta TaxID=3983 RepID=UPI000B5D17CB|nr:probable cyclic nucleotide-gated ion channel 20, chloroplastic isoform X7 [Manihot esculenta]